MTDFKNILAIIPARGGSKRLPGKNIKTLAGKPLIAHSIEYAKNSPEVNKIILSSEDDNIGVIGEQFGAEFMKRPLELAQDTTKTAPVLLHVIDELEKTGYKPDLVILLQATCPVRQGGLVKLAIDTLSANPEYDSFFTGFKKSFTMALWVKNSENKSHALYDYHLRPRWQDVEVNDKLIAEDGGFYAIKYDAFRKYKDFVGKNPYIHEVPYTVDIDNQADFDRAEGLIQEAKKCH